MVERKAPLEPRTFTELRTVLRDRKVSLIVSRLFPAALDRYLAALSAMSLILVALFARDDHFGAVAEAAKKFFAILPAQSELGHIGEA